MRQPRSSGALTRLHGPAFGNDLSPCRASADSLGQPDQNALGASDVAEPIHVFVLDHFVDELRAVLAEPGERIVEVVHGEHDAEVTESVHRGVPVIGDHRRREKSREFDPAVAVWRPHHGGLDALVAESSDAPGPVPFDHGSPFEFEAQLGEKRDSGIKRFHHDADVVHPLKRHAAILAVRKDPRCGMSPRAVVTARWTALAAGHQDVLVAFVVERSAGKPAIESFEPQARDVEQPQPFVLGGPPERTGSTIVQGDVDSVIADAVVVRVRQRDAAVRVDMLAVQGGCDVMVEGERVPGEAAVRPKRCRDPLEAAATISPRGQMQQRPPRAVDQGRRLLDLELPYVSFTQVELDSLLNCAHSSLREHRRRRVDPYYAPARCLSYRDRNAPGANRKLDQWPVSLTGKPDVERDVSCDVSGRPVPVSVRQGVVPARHGNTNLRANEAAFGSASPLARVGWLSMPSGYSAGTGVRGPPSERSVDRLNRSLFSGSAISPRDTRTASSPIRQRRMEPLWSPAVATGGNRSQM